MEINYDKLNTFLIIIGIFSIIITIIWVNLKLKMKKEVDEKNKQDEILLGLCLTAAKVGTWQYNIQEDVLLWSKEMIDLFGQNANNLQDFFHTIHKDDREKIKKHCELAIKHNIPYQQDYRIIMPNGSIKTISARGEVYKDKFLGVATDITEEKKNKSDLLEKTEELEEINEELTKFAYITSHDLKAPLRALSNLSDWVLEEVSKVSNPTEDLKKYVGLIKNRTNRMESLINGILEYSRVGRYNTEKEIVNLNIILNEVVEIVGKKGFEIKLDLMPIILVNKIRMTQVFTNLISNSIKHHDKENGIIEIKYEEQFGFHKFRIIDDGPGIDKKYHKKIFEIFQTLGTKEGTDSTGIGLTLVKKIVEDLSGEIGVISELGKGTEIWFTLPKVLHE